MEIIMLHDDEHEPGLRFEFTNFKVLKDKVFADPDNYIFLSDDREYAKALSYVVACLAGSSPPPEDEADMEVVFLFSMIAGPTLYPAVMKKYVVGLLTTSLPGSPNAVFFAKRGELEKRKGIILTAIAESIEHHKNVGNTN